MIQLPKLFAILVLLTIPVFVTTGCGQSTPVDSAGESSNSVTTDSATTTTYVPADSATTAIYTLPADVATSAIYPLPEDFSFVASYGVGAKNVLDTAAGTFTKDMIMDPPVTTELHLTQTEMEDLNADLIRMKILDYPSNYQPDAADTGPSMSVTPHMTYKLEIHLGDETVFDLVWEDTTLSAKPAAIALRDWFKKLQQIIEAKPEWKALPPAQGGYA